MDCGLIILCFKKDRSNSGNPSHSLNAACGREVNQQQQVVNRQWATANYRVHEVFISSTSLISVLIHGPNEMLHAELNRKHFKPWDKLPTKGLENPFLYVCLAGLQNYQVTIRCFIPHLPMFSTYNCINWRSINHEM